MSSERLDEGVLQDDRHTSDQNLVERITIAVSQGQQVGPLETVPTTPKGNLAAVLWKGKVRGADVEEVIVFYQPQTSNTIWQYGTDTIGDVDDHYIEAAAASKASAEAEEIKPFVLATATLKVTGSGKSKQLGDPVIGHVVHTFE